jgi:hypothetical protein
MSTDFLGQIAQLCSEKFSERTQGSLNFDAAAVETGSHIHRLAVFGEFMAIQTYQFAPLAPLAACAPHGK